MSLLPIHNRPVAVADTPCFMLLVEGCAQADFPSLGDDFAVKRINLSTELTTHPQATFMVRVLGDSMTEAGISDGDVVIVDRSLKPEHGSVVVAVVDGEFMVKHLHQQAGEVTLRAANAMYPNIITRDGYSDIWGVVTANIKRFRR